jgi:Domain of unknown function (DUF5127)/Domain of unknown function (DUF4965)/Domain of unknown function (DUF1793)/Domain of unknown function (DUF4964)/TAT (twin-arginine translocation) pathway signal sequence
MQHDEDRGGSTHQAATGPGSPGKPPVTRRSFLGWSGVAGAAGVVAGTPLSAVAATKDAAGPAGAQAAANATAAATSSTAVTPAFQPIRPPAAPLAVRSPYLSTWLPASTLPGTWEQFWTGHVTAMAGIARIDGTPYMFMGAPSITLTVPNGNNGNPSTITGFEQALSQTLLEVTPTRSRFHLEGGGVGLVVEFLSPVEIGDLRRQSIPMSYVLVSASSVDGKPHHVQVYADITGEWCSGDDSQVITWAPYKVAAAGGGIQAWAVQLQNQQPLTEQNQLAAWGTVVWATPRGPGLTFQSGRDLDVRGQFCANGALANSNDTGYRAISSNWPVFGLAMDLGQVGGTGGAAVTVPFSIGHVRTPAVSYQGQNLQPLWSTYFPSWQDMLAFFHGDLPGAQQRARSLDTKITTAAQSAGGQSYEGLCAIALRQAYGGTELVAGPDGSPWAFLKEISSDGNVSTVDVLYPASPVWLYTDPSYLALLLEPLLSYAESGKWPQPFSPHDLGSAYPNASGHNDGGGENMPVEESGNMLIMSAGYVQRAPAAAGKAFAAAHYKILKQWADYLAANLPDPGYQNQTDDFAGSIAHSVNLALKGIIAVAAMGQLATVAGNTSDAQHYHGLASQFIGYWASHAQDPSGAHLDLTYSGSGGGDGTWGTTYNGYADRLLGTGLVPDSIRAEQARWYPSVSNLYGLPLQVPHSYAKSDWEIFTAAWLSGYPVSQQLIDQVYDYANTTSSRVPFSDLYDTITGNQAGFQARPVQGGVFALLTLASG